MIQLMDDFDAKLEQATHELIDTSMEVVRLDNEIHQADKLTNGPEFMRVDIELSQAQNLQKIAAQKIYTLKRYEAVQAGLDVDDQGEDFEATLAMLEDHRIYLNDLAAKLL